MFPVLKRSVNNERTPRKFNLLKTNKIGSPLRSIDVSEQRRIRCGKYDVRISCSDVSLSLCKSISDERSRPVMNAASPTVPATVGQISRPCSGVPNRLLELVEVAAYSPWDLQDG